MRAAGSSGRGRRVRCTAVLVVGMVLATALATPARAAPGRSQPVVLPPEWLEKLNAYVADPVRQRAPLLEVAGKGVDGLPPEALVPIADAYLREGDLRTAEKLFERALDGPPSQPWESAALLGLGVTRVARGDLDGGLPWLEKAAAGGGQIADGAQLMLGQIETGRGNYEAAVDHYHDILTRGDAAPEIAQAAHVGTADAYFRSGDFERAANEFQAAAERDPESKLAQDARYGAARARMRGGDHEGAREDFVRLSAVCSPDEMRGRSTRRQRDLDPRGVLRAWLESYSRLPFHGPLVDSGGIWGVPICVYTRATLERYETEARSSFQVTPAGATLGPLSGEEGGLDDAGDEGEGPLPTAAPASAGAPAPPAAEGSPLPATLAAVGGVVVVALLALRRRSARAPGNPAGGSKR